MKLNITTEKLQRVLVAANTVLANCKGSRKAVRLFLNELGFTNTIIRGLLTVKLMFTDDEKSFVAMNHIYSTWYTHTEDGQTSNLSEPSKSGNEIVFCQNNTKTVSGALGEIQFYVNDMLQNVSSVTKSDYKTIIYGTLDTISALKDKNNRLKIIITNSTDADILPVKSVLAKQLQEILPINMIVEADNIIGCANE